MQVSSKGYLGELRLVEVYRFYDRPVFYSCRNGSGQYFVALWIDDGEDGNETWLYAPVSTRRLRELNHGLITSREVFTQAEDSRVLLVRTRLAEVVDVIPLTTHDLSDDMLPKAGLYVVSDHPDVEENGAIEYASRNNRDCIFLHLDFPEISQLEAPADRLGAVLCAVQKTLDSLVGAEFDRKTTVFQRDSDKWKKERRKFVRRGNMRFVGHAYGSYQIQLASANTDLFSDNVLADSIELLAEVLRTAEDREGTKAILLNAGGGRVTNSYVEFLAALRKSRSPFVQLDWATRTADRSGTVTVSTSTLDALIEQLNSWTEVTLVERTFIGVVRGFLPKSGKFEIEDEGILEGKLSDDIGAQDRDVIATATLGQFYEITLQEKTTTRIASGDETIERLLVRISPFIHE